MQKVKITQEQADAIERERTSGDEKIVMHHIERGWSSVYNKCLKALTTDTLIKALYIGYEVEPEFKVGDWIKDTSTGAVLQIRDMQHRNNIMDKRYTTKRHATPSEIAEEKERRFWKKHGRNPWELKKSDVLSINDEVLEIESIGELSITFEDNYWITMKEFESLKHNIRIVCFKENRLDVKTNE